MNNSVSSIALIEPYAWQTASSLKPSCQHGLRCMLWCSMT